MATVPGGSYISDTQGNEVLQGDATGDSIFAYYGYDTIIGGSASEYIETSGDHEQIYAGSGNDTIQADGAFNFIQAGSGNDTIIGQNASDTFVFNSNGGKDVVMNFQAGDILQIQRNINGLMINSAADLLPHVADQNGSAVITLGDESITLLGVSAADVHSNPTGYFTIH